MKLPFKLETDIKLITNQKRGAVVNYEPITITDYKFFEKLWEYVKTNKPDLIEKVESDFTFLSDNGNYDNLKEFTQNSNDFKNEDMNIMCDFNNFMVGVDWMIDSLTRYNGKERFSKNNVVCKRESCLTYLQVYRDNLFVVSRGLDIDNFFIYNALMIKLMADKLCCSEIKWEIIAPFNYVENVLLNKIETIDDLLNKQFLHKFRKGV